MNVRSKFLLEKNENNSNEVKENIYFIELFYSESYCTVLTLREYLFRRFSQYKQVMKTEGFEFSRSVPNFKVRLSHSVGKI